MKSDENSSENPMQKPNLNVREINFSDHIAFHLMVALTKIQKIEESHTFFPKKCVKSKKSDGIPSKIQF